MAKSLSLIRDKMRCLQCVLETMVRDLREVEVFCLDSRLISEEGRLG